MKPKDLTRPFSWENRRVHLEDKVLFVPDYYTEYHTFSFPEWHSSSIFPKNQPVHIEYCSGNGQWISQKAIAHPEVNWVAIEKRFDRCQKIWSKVKNNNITNLLIVCGEGLITTKEYFPSNSVKEIYVNFPDPWPKDKHAKHRIITSDFLKQSSRILCNHGTLNLVTDHTTYQEQMIKTVMENKQFTSLYPSPYYIYSNQEYGDSWFLNLWKEKERTIHYMKFKKDS
jgi:tRNA (guanine-N7-)-methyltransferase